MDHQLRLSERDGSVNLLLRYRAGLVSLQTMKRLAVCGNRDAAAILGFRKKVRPHLLAVLKVMMRDCPERVTQILQRRVAVTEFTHPKRSPTYRWMRKGSRLWSDTRILRSESHFLLAKNLISYGMPGFWWVGRELCKLGRIL
jgi:hypothetical protein